MSNLTYIDFLKKTRGEGNFALIEDFPNAIEQTHGSKHISFKKAYQEAYGKSGVIITPVHAPLRLRIGFIEDDGSSQIWHTVRLEAWHTSANKGCELEEYILEEEKKDISYIAVKGSELLLQGPVGNFYVPLFVASLGEEGYFYINENKKMTKDEFLEAGKKWDEEENNLSFYEFLNKGEEDE